MKYISESEVVVIKIGSALVVRPDTGRVNRYWMSGLAKDVIALREQGKHVCLVCSGATALGRDLLGLNREDEMQEEKRAAAACGQIVLMRAWQQVFYEDDVTIAQLLLTIDDSESRKRYLNARSTLKTLLKRGVVPIINENDTVASTQLKVGDNDRLGARVAQMVGADALVLLSDIDGLYTADPSKNPDAKFIPEIHEITEDIRAYAAPAATDVGTGGMITKVEAAAIATASGCNTIISRGDIHKPIAALRNGLKSSVFVAHTTPMSARKEWIAGALSPHGVIYVDAGAEKALNSGNSLLPVGIVAIEGEFHIGDAVAVQIRGAQNPIAKGLVSYNSDELTQIIGIQSQDISQKLGYNRGDAVVHRDDMVML